MKTSAKHHVLTLVDSKLSKRVVILFFHKQISHNVLSPVYAYRVFAAAAKRNDFSLSDDKQFVALISENRWRVQRFVASGSATRVQRETRK